MFRRLARVLIRQRVDDLVRIVLRDVVGDRVDEMDERSGLAAFVFGQFGAFFACAVVPPVILGDAEDHGFRMLLDAFADLRRRDAEDVRIRQTELRPFDDALPLDFRIVFRMLRPVDGRRHKRVERMDEAAVNDVAAPLRIRADGRAVHLVAHAELRRIVARVVRVALFQIRHENILQVVQFHRLGRFRDERAVRREPTAAQIVVQQRIDGIQHAALSAAEQQCMVLRIAFHMDALQAKFLIIDAEAVFFQQTAAAEEDRIFLDIRLVRHNVEQLPRHFL